jgi:recombination protein RecA
MFGNPETTPGGRALKFYSSVRLDIRRTGAIKDPKGVVVGNRVNVKVVKNKVAPPFREGEFDILFGEGISKEGSVIDIGASLGVIEKKGSWFTFKNEKLGQGREQARDLLKKEKSLMQEIVKAVKEKTGLKA